MDINAAAKEYGNGVITSLKKNRRILYYDAAFCSRNDNRRTFAEKG